jgi:hypothetical protein
MLSFRNSRQQTSYLRAGLELRSNR